MKNVYTDCNLTSFMVIYRILISYRVYTHTDKCTHVIYILYHNYKYSARSHNYRVELTVNLPKLEPFLSPCDDLEASSGSATSLREGRVTLAADSEREFPAMAGEKPPSSTILPGI